MRRVSRFALTFVLAGAMAWPVPAPASAAAPRQVHVELTRPSVMQEAANAAARPAGSLLTSEEVMTPLAVRPLAPTITPLQREVFGFVNASNLGSSTVGYASWNFALLSTVAFFSLHVNSGDGALVQNDTGWAVYHSSTMASFVSKAHASGTKVVVSINLHDFSTGPTNQVCQGLQPANAQVTINQSIAQMNAAGIDGINIDYEGTDSVCANGQSSRAEMDSFTQNMRAAMPKGSYLSIDTYSGSAEDNLEFFDIAGLQPSVDAFFIMAYDMDGANWSSPPLNCSSYCFSPVSPLNTYRFNVTKSVSQYLTLVPASKIILGQPYYGSRGCAPTLNAAHQYPVPNTNFVSPTYIYASTIPTQTGVYNFAAHRDPSDGVSEWDTWYDTDWSCNREQYFDDVFSLGAKYDVVNFNKLRGVGLFTLDYGGGSPELWNLLAAKFTTLTPWEDLGGVAAAAPGASSWSSTNTVAFVAGTDNGLWYKSWDGAAWGIWQPLGGVLTSRPAAISWGPNRIDAFVRGSDNQLWHRWYANGVWYQWEPLGGILTSGPAVASWTNNRLDVFVRGTDYQLWHKWYVNGAWYGWEALGGILTSDPASVAWGYNRIDVFARGTDNQLWHKWYSDGGWYGWEPLGGILISGPAAASCGLAHLDVFVVSSDSALWRRSFTAGAWSAWQPQGGRFTSDPWAQCRSGTTTLDAFARGIDNGVWHTSMAAA